MKKFLLAVLFFLFPVLAYAQAPCTHWASPTGTGNGLSVNTPFKIYDFLHLTPSSLPGKVLCLAGGTYTGANSMIDIPGGIHGTSSQPITIRALSESPITNVPLIDGQAANTPIYLPGNNYWVIEGVDATNSPPNRGVVTTGSGGSSNNIFRRICAWDAWTGSGVDDYTANVMAWFLSYGDHNLAEDVCGFGSSRKIFQNINSTNLTVRRAWGMWNSSVAWATSDGAPKFVYSITYNSYGGTYENVIGTWDGSATSSAETAIFGADGPSGNFVANVKYLGSIGYVKAGQTLPNTLYGMQYWTVWDDRAESRDVILYDGGRGWKGLWADAFQGGSGCSTEPGGVCDRKLTNVTTISAVADHIGGDWTGTPAHYATVAAMNSANANPFQTTAGTGARVCWQYKDGVLQTGTPLWPWPMDARIRQALSRKQAASGDPKFNPDTVFGGTNYSVTQQMEALFGSTKACQGAAAIVSVSITDPAKDGAVILATPNPYPMLGTSNLP